MHVGICQVELTVVESMSLKDKRRVVKSLKDRLHREHQVSVAEVGRLEDRRVAVLGLSAVSNSSRHVRGMLEGIVENLRGDARVELMGHQIEVLSGQ